MALPTIAFDPNASSGTTGRTDAPADLVGRLELGRGGMGVVHLAEQRSLGREVAVKTVVSNDELAVRALVREARIMGSLEHPNLVPVHALGIDGDGAPILVMKRVEGVSWRALLSDPHHHGWKPLLVGHGDPLRANLEILSQLCRALAFAHDRGVVHLDLKPDNVMVGRFGEVYLIDWGIALRLAERDSEAAAIVGTPGYLAPEMARADPRLIDARTDVYLLGGALYEVLTGRMPHHAPTALAALVLALNGEIPAIADDLTPELAHLARRALAPNPADRVPSAEVFREGLALFLAAREVNRAVEEAKLSLARARESIAREGTDSLDAFRALIEARTIFLSAHGARPEDDAIRANLDACTSHLVEREIALRSPVAARVHLNELRAPVPELESRVRELEQVLAAERAAAAVLAASREAADTSASLRNLTATLTISGAVLVPAYWLASRARGEDSSVSVVAIGLSSLLGALLLFVIGRRTALASEASRQLAGFVVVILATLVVVPAITFARGGTQNDAATQVFGACAALWALGSLALVRELWPNVAICLAATCLSIALPESAFLMSAPVTALVMLVLWRGLRIHAARSRVR